MINTILVLYALHIYRTLIIDCADKHTSNKVALVVIMTDGESTDESIIESLKPLEWLPIQIIDRNFTGVAQYWQNVNLISTSVTASSGRLTCQWEASKHRK